MSPAAPDDHETLARLRLARSENVGPATFRRLVGRYGSAVAALEALPDLARRGGMRRAPRIETTERALAEIEAGAAIGAALLHLETPDYPELLAEIDSAPPLLWRIGPAASIPKKILTKKTLAIVGGRNASALGQRFAADLAATLAGEGLTIVSGLARGVDAAAHAGALAGTESARDDAPLATVAVLAGGVDVIYPQENTGLYQDIAQRGVILSERPVGHQPKARDFPRRNRIISGLSLGVLVIEGRDRSGSLITAEAALDQGREVMAAPGHPLDARAAGANRLIRDGAALIRSADDVLEALGPSLTAGYPRPRREAQGRLFDQEPGQKAPDHGLADAVSPEALGDRLLGLLGPSVTPLDDLIRIADAPAGAVAAALLELELAGRVTREPGGGVALAASETHI